MRNILFVIVSTVFIVGCGASSSSPSSSSASVLTAQQAQQGSVLIYKNLSQVQENKAQEIQEIEKETGLSAEEFAYSTDFDCESLGYKQLQSQTIESVDDDPAIYFYTTAQSQCIEFDFATTESAGSEGLVLLLK